MKEQEKEGPIVCGTDFSTTAVEAVDVASEIARRLKVRLILVHVEQFAGLAISDARLLKQVVLQNRLELNREAKRLRKLGTKVEEKVLSGSVFNELVNAAAECKARLIIVGAVGHGMGHRLLVGSAAERVAETSTIPTLVVRPGSRLGSWLRNEHPLKILVGYDFSPAGDAALRWLNDMQHAGLCEINVVHIYWPPDEAHRLGYHGPLRLAENPEEIQNFLERDLSERVSMVLAPEKVTVMVQPGWGRTEGYLFALAHQERVDLIVVGTHRRHGLDRLRFGSVSRAVLHHAGVSVAVIPPAQDRKRATIPTMDRVLVATDFSDLGNKAVSYGCAILRHGGTLKLIHVIAPAAAPKKSKKTKPANDDANLLAQLRSLVPPDAEERFDLKFEIVEENSPAKAIAQQAERFDADAICLGSHGRSGLAKALLGSVAQEVMAKSKRPILTVR
jgi:nucleotide-binding universal stress UspA family protein